MIDEPTELSFGKIKDLEILESLAIQTEKKIEEKRKNRTGASSPKNRVQMRSMAKEKPRTQTEDAGPAESVNNSAERPQYRYISAAENSKLLTDVLNKGLDATIGLTLKELLAISPDICHQIKDLVLTRQVPNSDSPKDAAVLQDSVIITEASSMLHMLPSSLEDIIVANHFEDLRCISVMINGSIPAEAILDDGSQSIGIRKDLWEKTGLPLRCNHLVNMEAVNKSKSMTLGLLQDLKVVIGGYTFYVQAQVLKKASYQMLLGLPFFTLTQAAIKHWKNGDTSLVLEDPNTQATIKVPTFARQRE